MNNLAPAAIAGGTRIKQNKKPRSRKGSEKVEAQAIESNEGKADQPESKESKLVSTAQPHKSTATNAKSNASTYYPPKRKDNNFQGWKKVNAQARQTHQPRKNNASNIKGKQSN
jgi:hypothetical protein